MKIDGAEYHIKLKEQTFQDPMEITVAILGGKWKILLLWDLKEGPMRFSEMLQMRPELTGRMLSRQLKALQQTGLVERTAYAEVPPRVEYELTDEGKTLLPVLEVLAALGNYKADQGKLVKLSSV